MLVYGLKGLCAYADHALIQGHEMKEIYELVHEALAFLLSKEAEDINKVIQMLMKCGKINLLTMKMLHEANGIQTPHVVSTKPVEGKCILVSGHDLKVLEELLKLTEKEGINVYTHGEMLPAHGYEKLRKFSNLKGHLGGAWQKQSIEFSKFPGAIFNDDKLPHCT
jgi:hydroxylamine reductase